MQDETNELLQKILKLMEAQQAKSETQDARQKWFVTSMIISALSLALSPLFFWQLAEIRADNRQNHSDRTAYESATQNVLNRYIGQNEGRLQGVQIRQYKDDVDAEKARILEKQRKEGLY
jgi:hypothetical protein